ncbi:MAG TPA: hypothetical protein GX401_09955 [Clostridiales bacterium]|nr:hypothetical protein [Clostridiales bacterium]
MKANEINTKIDFPNHTDYRIGAVTYQVAAHFNENDGQSLKSKINHLLSQETQKTTCRTFAAEQDRDI